MRETIENTLFLTLLARFLLVRKAGYGDLRLCRLIPELNRKGNIIPMVLAEIVNNVDERNPSTSSYVVA